MEKETGGPAFPVDAELCQDITVEEQRGMTLRDYFAAKAMQAMLPTYDIPLVFDDETWKEGEKTMPELIAIDAYVMADAMLKAREQ